MTIILRQADNQTIVRPSTNVSAPELVNAVLNNSVRIDQTQGTTAQQKRQGQANLDLRAAATTDERPILRGEPGYIEVDTVNNLVKFPFFQMDRLGQGLLIAGTGTSVTVDLPLSTNTTTVFYYVDWAETTQADRIKSTTTRSVGARADSLAVDGSPSGGITPLGHSNSGKFTAMYGFDVRTTADLTRQSQADFIPTGRDAEREMARFVEAERSEKDAFWSSLLPVGSGDTVAITPPFEGYGYSMGANAIADLDYMQTGRSAKLYGRNAFFIYAGIGKTFTNGNNRAQVIVPNTGVSNRGSVATVENSPVGPVIEVTEGVTVNYSTITDLTPTEHVVYIGQSHANLTHEYVAGIFGNAMQYGDTAARVAGIYGYTNASEGGTGTVTAGGFWDASTDGPTALLTTKTDAIDARTTVQGWPRAKTIYCMTGDSDRGAFSTTNPNTGQPYTVAELAYFFGRYLDHVRSFCDPTAILMLDIFGAARDFDANTGTTSAVNCTASREAYLIAAAARSWVHVVENKAQRSRQPGEVHLDPIGYARQAWEAGQLAGYYRNALTPALHPTIGAITHTAQGASAIVTITPPSGKSNHIPATSNVGAVEAGPFPFGFGLIRINESSLTGLMNIERGVVRSDGRVELVVAEGEDVRTSRLITHAGQLKDASVGRFIRTADNARYDSGAIIAVNGRGIRPFISANISVAE